MGRLSFSHALFRETIYEQLSATRKAAIHGRLAAAIEEAPTDRPDERAGTLAYHYRAAGELRKAFDYYRRAAATAERVYAQETVLENLEGAIVAGEMLGMTAAAEESIRELYRARAWTLELLGEPDRALADLEHALEGARAAGDRAGEMHVHNALGICWHVRDPQASRRCHEEALRIAEELGDESGQVNALNRLSLVLANELEFAEAVELGERALEIARRAGDELAVSRAMDSLKFAALQLGDVERLRGALRRARASPARAWRPVVPAMDAVRVLLRAAGALRLAGGRAAYRRGAGHQRAYRRSQQRGADTRHVELDRALPRRLRTIARIRPRGRHTRGQTDADWLGWTAAGLATPLLDLRAADEAIAVLERGLAAAERNRARGQIFRCLGALSSATRLAGAEPGRAPSPNARSRSQSGSRRRPAKSTSGASGPTSRSPRPSSPPATSPTPRRQCEAAWRPGSAAARGGRSQRPPASWPAAPRRAATGLRRRECSRERRGGRRRGLLCERWQIEAGLARVDAAAGRSEEAEDRTRRAHELIDAMAASVGDGEIGARFRERALAEIDEPGPTLRH